jgi:hypothetical protein
MRQAVPDGGLPGRVSALPVLYAAIAGNSFAGPSRFAHTRGAPELMARSAAAQDPDLARFWAFSEQLTGIRSDLQPVPQRP